MRNFKTLAFTVLKLCYAPKSVTKGRMDGRTEGQMDGRTTQKQYAPPTPVKLGA